MDMKSNTTQDNKTLNSKLKMNARPKNKLTSKKILTNKTRYEMFACVSHVSSYFYHG